MKTSLRKLVRGVLREAMGDGPHQRANDGVVHFEGYAGLDLQAKCDFCNVPLWLVWEDSNPGKHWTECGGIGEGSCVHRAGRDEDDERSCAICDKTDVTLDHDGLCQMCERMLVRIKMMNPSLDDDAAVAYGRSLRVNKR